MNAQSLIIYKFSELYHILEELRLDLNFNILSADNHNTLNEIIKNLDNYLIITNKEHSNIDHQFILDHIFINIFKLIEKINMNF